MAHYAFATAIMNLGMNIPSMLSGFVSDWLGYRGFFIWVMVATIPSFLMTWFVPFREIGKFGIGPDTRTTHEDDLLTLLVCCAWSPYAVSQTLQKEIIGYFPSWKWQSGGRPAFLRSALPSRN